jgi:hypothetical protein
VIAEVGQMAGLLDDEAERAVAAVFGALQRLAGSPTGQQGVAWEVFSELPNDLKRLVDCRGCRRRDLSY